MAALKKKEKPVPPWEKARLYAQEVRDMRKRLNILPLQRIPYDIAK